jgi:hypothetical protein
VTKLRPEVLAQLPAKQQELARLHGTPSEFAQAVYRCVPAYCSMDEAKSAVAAYEKEWAVAGGAKPAKKKGKG